MSRLADLIARQPKGTTLLQEFYRDEEVFRRDIERIHMSRWLCVGHESRIPEKGDFFVFDVAGESFIIARGRDGVIRAFANVCRHRGSQVCYDKEGNRRAFVCPYHGWTYDLDGRLRSARLAGKSFDTSRYGLREVHLHVVRGLVLICCAEQPPSLADAEQALSPVLDHYGWGTAKVAHRAVYSVDANWKLATENYMECYHCGPAHPEFSWYHATTRPPEETTEIRDESKRRAAAMGIEIPDVDRWPDNPKPGQESVDCWHDATLPGSVTGSEDGQKLAPLMGDFTDYDGGFSYFDIGPASYFLAYPDHGVMYLFIPQAAQKTDMEVVWLVRGDAVEGRDYDRARLTWMWDVTSVADKRIIDHNQKGVNSRFYQPGPYLPMEATPRRFGEWYLDQIRERDESGV
jgi:Rieske 2Fe-2S family protein